MKKTIFAVVAVAAMSMFSVAQANEIKGVGFAAADPNPTILDHMGVAAKVGSAGAGVDFIVPVNDKFKVRLGYSGYNFSGSDTRQSVNYDYSAKIGGWNLLGDWHPTGGGFRLSGGLYSPNYDLSGNAKMAGGTVTVNGVTYNSTDLGSLSMSAKWNKVSPYIGIGYDGFNSTKAGFFFTADAGVIVTSGPKVKLTANCTSATASVCTTIASDVAAEQTKVQNDLNSFKALPVVQIGVGYRF